MDCYPGQLRLVCKTIYSPGSTVRLSQTPRERGLLLAQSAPHGKTKAQTPDGDSSLSLRRLPPLRQKSPRKSHRAQGLRQGPHTLPEVPILRSGILRAQEHGALQLQDRREDLGYLSSRASLGGSFDEGSLSSGWGECADHKKAEEEPRGLLKGVPRRTSESGRNRLGVQMDERWGYAGTKKAPLWEATAIDPESRLL